MADINNRSTEPLTPVMDSEKEAAVLALVKQTGYPIYQENGQRMYGPIPNWTGPQPRRGCEVFVGKLPRDCYEDELVPIFTRAGTIYELRLMMDFSGLNRGFCFVTFTTSDEAKTAVRILNNYEIRKGKFLGVCLSVDNCRLFVGGLPRNKHREEILEEMTKLVDGVVDCIVYPDARDKSKNRGFAFVEFESHRAAAMARRKLVTSTGSVHLWGHQIAIDWAEPESEIDQDVMAQVKILYVRNLMMETNEERIEKLCNEAIGKEDAIERVKKLRDFAFVHFKERSDALIAMENLNGKNVDGSAIEVVLAKPVDKNNAKQNKQELQSAVLGLPGISYISGGSLVTSSLPGTNTGHGPRELLGRNPLVMGARETTKGRVRGAGGIGRIYSQTRSPYKKMPNEGRSFGILPGMDTVIFTNPFILNPPQTQPLQNKLPAQLLEEICIANGWGLPFYQLYSTVKQEGGNETQLFLYKLHIPSIPNAGFLPTKLCPMIEEAKDCVAQNALIELIQRGLIPDGNMPSISSLPAPAPAPPTVLATPGLYRSQPLMTTSPAQFLLTSPSFGDLSSESTSFPLLTSPTYYVSAGKVTTGNSFPAIYPSPYTTIPMPAYNF